MSGQLRADLGGGMWKSEQRFRPALTMDLLGSLAPLGIRQPASYGSCYHALAESVPKVTHTINNIFAWWPGGPWQEAKATGTFLGKHYRYDLCSAYRWAATLGLPDTKTFRVWKSHKDPRSVNGLWVVALHQTDANRVPALLAGPGPVVVSSEDLRLYDITPARIYRGVTWSESLPGDFVEKTLAQLPCAKQSGRAYWGRWITRDRLTCRTANNEWSLPNFATNFVWGFLIIARVRARVWQVSKQALHVYVDEVIVPHEIETGGNIGDWHLKETYEHGVDVRGTGWLGTTSGATIMHTGHPHSQRLVS